MTSLSILFSKLNRTTDRAVWDPPDMSKCLRTVDFDDLENITVTVGKLSIWVFIWVLFARENKSTLKSTFNGICPQTTQQTLWTWLRIYWGNKPIWMMLRWTLCLKSCLRSLRLEFWPQTCPAALLTLFQISVISQLIPPKSLTSKYSNRHFVHACIMIQLVLTGHN